MLVLFPIQSGIPLMRPWGHGGQTQPPGISSGLPSGYPSQHANSASVPLAARLLLGIAAALLFTATTFAQQALHLPPAPGVTAGMGKRVVVIAGDEEYRSEESCPMLAKILSQRHGFDCTVLFPINPKGGYVDPNYLNNIDSLEALDSADLLIIGTRFRKLPDEQLAHFASFLNAGKPVIGFRTATHAFAGAATTGDFKWATFGVTVLGEKWAGHHGEHGKEGTRTVVESVNGSHEVLRGVGEIFVTTDVYGVKNLDQKAATILLRGAVTESLDPASGNLAGAKNEPMMPVAWLREYTAPNGTTKGRAFCTTMGASVDFSSEGLRRLVVNATYHLLGLPVPQKSDVTFVDPYQPTMFGTMKDKTAIEQRNLKPSDFGLGHSPTFTPLPEALPSQTKGQ